MLTNGPKHTAGENEGRCVHHDLLVLSQETGQDEKVVEGVNDHQFDEARRA
jgi:hypothetical protein